MSDEVVKETLSILREIRDDYVNNRKPTRCYGGTPIMNEVAKEAMSIIKGIRDRYVKENKRKNKGAK